MNSINLRYKQKVKKIGLLTKLTESDLVYIL